MTRIPSSRGRLLRLAALSLLVSGCFAVFTPTPSHAESLETLLPYVIENHDRVRSSKASLSAARNRAREALGGWYPTLSQTANAGHEIQQNDGSADTRTGFSEYDISLTQLLWDFGSTNASIDKARLEVESARFDLIETRQSLILEAITAYMNTIRSNAALGFAKDSEENIRRQTGLEEALVGLGSGFSTDVLQAKTQLAGAQARRAQSEGGLINALNRFQAVYGRMPDNIAALTPVPYPAAFLPVSLTQATDVAMETNPSLKNAILDADIAVEDVRIARADNFTPKIEASAERKLKKNVGGTIGPKEETLAKVEMTFDFNLGFTAVNTLRASENDLSATTFTAADTRRTIEEQVRNAWQQLETAKQTASHLNNQANIAAAFLELARNERQLGRRSLIDVLSGETNLINAKSDALSAETDVLLAAYGLLAATGQLEYDVISRSKGIKAPVIKQPSSSGTSGTEAPAASPVQPVTPAPSNQSGDIEPDVTVASGRTTSDLQALYAMAEQANIREMPDVSEVYAAFSKSHDNTVQFNSTANAEQSRYTLLHDSDTAPSKMDTTAEPFEYASTDQSLSSTPSETKTLPAESDTAVVELSSETVEVLASSNEENIAYETFAADDDMALNDAKQDELTEIALINEPVTAFEDDNTVTYGIDDLFDFFAEAARANEQSQETSVEIVSADVSEMATIQDAPQAAVETAHIPVHEQAASSSEAPASDILDTIVSFIESGQPLDDDSLTAPSEPEVLVASIQPEDTVIAPTDTAYTAPETQETGALFDLIEFLDAAHKRSLESQDDDGASDVAVIDPTPVENDTIEQHSQDDTTSPPSDLLAFLGNLVSGDTIDTIDLAYTPMPVDQFDTSDRN